MKRVAFGAFAARLSLPELDAIGADVQAGQLLASAFRAVQRESTAHGALALHLLTRPRALPSGEPRKPGKP